MNEETLNKLKKEFFKQLIATYVAKTIDLEFRMYGNDGIATIWSIVDKKILKSNLKLNCIPEGFDNMTVEDFDEFLKQRRILMAKKIEEYYYSL